MVGLDGAIPSIHFYLECVFPRIEALQSNAVHMEILEEQVWRGKYLLVATGCLGFCATQAPTSGMQYVNVSAGCAQ